MEEPMSEEFGFIDLFRGPEEIVRAQQERMAKAQELQRATAEITGVAASEDERIKVTFSESDGLRNLVLDPRVLRLPSEDLAHEIIRIVNQARDDARKQLQQLVADSAQDGLPDPESVLEKMPEIERSVDELMRDSQAMTHQLMDIVERMKLAGESTPRRRPDSQE